ncbi:hypothetical protein [Falsihalocynthiibacter arcticus]|uniref:Uncharacterized protein n=1 Tax=Falsihalocynthiibacter arcticus TaxID=1579316 RepID=A0A126UZT0_9RHOB|nr:hypothetical protein [Falsihalocynthiibacter arcticus]AML51578.1 hypothetical protein RC74_10170 [Falsihalocynthiibacter arcticus]
MSDPVANIEIEDVLSSIRRLFKEDRRHENVAEEIPEKQGVSAALPQEGSDDRLVLIPAFRVDPNREKRAAEAFDPELESLIDAPVNGADSVDKPPKASVTRLHLLPDEAPKENLEVLVLGAWQKTLDETPQENTPNEAVESLVQQSLKTQVEAESEMAAQVDAISASLIRQSSLKATIAELEAAISKQGSVFEPDGSEEVGSIPENEPLQWQDADARTKLEALVAEPEVIELDAGPQEVDPDFVRRHAAPVGVDDFEEDEDPAPNFAHSEPDDLQEALDRDFGVNDLPIDEDALRDLVSEIVRQELQGALGERITRNVRKLVRREIHRIISSQEFE